MTNARADQTNDIAMLLFDFKTMQDMQKEWSNSIWGEAKLKLCH